ncbi:uncharacterized protein [Dermacentor albipictus]|uniref:uncharacterized protein n=1 Tax=Dermacentor albipictus TaxID=60249 RepID=UPI0038FC72FA
MSAKVLNIHKKTKKLIMCMALRRSPSAEPLLEKPACQQAIMRADNPTPLPADAPHVLRVEQAQSALKTTRRATWNTYISRLDRDQYTVFSCWLLLVTSVGLFIVLLLTFGKQFCMVVFLSISGLVVLFVLFVQPPEGTLRRQALRDVLVRRATDVGPGPAVASVHSQENVVVASAAASGSPASLHQKKKSPMGLNLVESPSLSSAPMYQLRKASMMFEKYDEACHVALPPSATSRAPQETTKRGFFRALISRIRKGHLQVNPYYTTLTEDALSIEEGAAESTTTKASARRSFDRGKGPTPEIKKRIGFQEDPLMEGEQLTGANTPPSTQSVSRRQRRSQSIRPLSDTEFSSRGRLDRSASVFATVTPGSSAPGLRPLKSGVKGSVTPKLGAPTKRTTSSVASRRTVNFTGVTSPAKKTSSPPRARMVEEWHKVANSSVSTGEEEPTIEECVFVSDRKPRETTTTHTKGSSSRKRRRGPQTSSSSPDMRVGSSRTYMLRDSFDGYRKIHHVWSK